MSTAEKVFEELLNTIERNTVDNRMVITNVRVFVDSWRRELDVEKKIVKYRRSNNI